MAGVQRNVERIFDISQRTEEGYVPVRTGNLRRSGYVQRHENGARVGYAAPYACIAYLNKHNVLLANGKTIKATKLRPGDTVRTLSGQAREVIAIQKQERGAKKILEIRTESGKTIYVTDNHLIPTADGELKPAGKLTLNDALLVESTVEEPSIVCELCGQTFKRMSRTHLVLKHQMSMAAYKEQYGTLGVFNTTPRGVWNQGATKESDPRIARAAEHLKTATSFKKDATRAKMRLNHWSKRGSYTPNNYKPENHTSVCRWCGEEARGYVFCGQEHALQWRRIRYSGENNPNYNKHNSRKNGTIRGGYRADLEHYVRSTWEANFGRILKLCGIKYAYEPSRFVLSDGRTYCPDFYVFDWDTYVEVKGWERDNKYAVAVLEYPEVNFAWLGVKQYTELEKALGKSVPGWEYKWRRSKKSVS